MAECDEQEMLEVMKVATEFGMVDIDLPGTDLNSCYLYDDNPVTGNNQPEPGTMAALFDELSLVGAGVGGGFDHTDELKVMNYREAMKSPDCEAWKDEIKNEYDRFQKYKVFKVVPRSKVPKGQHYMAENISSPVTNPVTIRIAWTLLCANPDWIVEALDVEGAFLQGKFRNGEVMYADVPDGMEQFYGSKGRGLTAACPNLRD
eukprot:scaffold11431_cov23-Cyclotella_meneghiniana.AAC.2